jgi:two-component system, OmpR family, alkaline phosphatase synthesis response regulator PhoP
MRTMSPSPRILVADDEPDMVELLSYTLQQRGYRVITASNGWEALNKARSLHPDLVILDVMMEDMNGFTVCEALRHHPPTASLPVIFLTAVAGQIPRVAGLSAGADDYLTKPFDPATLLQRVEQLLQARRAGPV